MRPHEETWAAASAVVVRDDGQWVARFSPSPGVSPDVEAARAQLAAQAPAMARLLLGIHQRGVTVACTQHNETVCPFCEGHFSEEYEPALPTHAPDCALVAILRAAGVLT